MFNIRTDDATINHFSSRVVLYYPRTRLHKIRIDNHLDFSTIKKRVHTSIT